MLDNVIRNVVDASATLIAQWLFALSLPNTCALVICVNACLVMEDAIVDFLARFEHWRNYLIHVLPLKRVAISVLSAVRM